MKSQIKTLPDFGPEYFESGNYESYLERGPRYAQMARELDGLFSTLMLADKRSIILDYGCGVGFLCSGLMEIGYENVSGYDVSPWAVQQFINRGVTYGMTKCDGLIALDVFEHMGDEEISDVFSKTDPRFFIARIPVSTDGGRAFHLKISRNDPTHINCKESQDWIGMFEGFGFTVLKLKMFTIYNSDGVACFLGVKKYDKLSSNREIQTLRG